MNNVELMIRAVKANDAQQLKKLLDKTPLKNPSPIFQEIFYGGGRRSHEEEVELAKVILSHPNIDPAQNDNSFLMQAALNRNPEIFKLLLELPPEKKVDPAARDSQAIWHASEVGNTEIVKMLLDLPEEKGIDPSRMNNAAIRIAAQNGHANIVEMLLDLPKERRVDPSALDNDAIREAARKGYANIVKMLLDLPKDRGVDPSAKRNLAIKSAVAEGHLEVVKLLAKDPRVDWRMAADAFPEIEAETRRAFIEKLAKLILIFKKTERSPDIQQMLLFQLQFEELCDDLKSTKIPSIELVTLAQLLKLDDLSSVRNMDKEDACRLVRKKLESLGFF